MKRREEEDPFPEGPYRTSAKPPPYPIPWGRVLAHMMLPVALLLFCSWALGWYMNDVECEAPYCIEARPSTKAPTCPVCPVCPECPEPDLSHRELGCVALCNGAQNVAWFARNDHQAYVCQCVHGPELPTGTRGLWHD